MKALTHLQLLLLLLSCSPQDPPQPSTPRDILKKHAVPIKNLSTLPQKIYKEIANYDVILMGEMHGTREPAEFAFGLCELIARQEHRVVLALEIPSFTMKNYREDMSLAELANVDFFNGENTDGRNGQAWLELIHKSNQHNNITVTFIDNYRYSKRDSSMYAEILDIKNTYPDTKIVTLTGNIHNWLIPFNNENRIGGYLRQDTINFDPERIMSIDHHFSEGTMLNNVGNGLELTIISPKENIYNKTLSAEMFFCKRVIEDQLQNTHILYTEKVSHSEVIEGMIIVE